MTFKKIQKQALGLFMGAIGVLIIGITMLTNTINWLWILISAILIVSGSIFWFHNR
jgi:ABC-type bacteriocin/lantibiotic exporter with double-glycine peptidase domain